MDSFRLDISVAESSRMGRLFNAIELKPYMSRTAQLAATAERVVEDDRTLATDFPDSDDDNLVADSDHLVAPNPALPRWQRASRTRQPLGMSHPRTTPPMSLPTPHRFDPLTSPPASVSWLETGRKCGVSWNKSGKTSFRRSISGWHDLRRGLARYQFLPPQYLRDTVSALRISPPSLPLCRQYTLSWLSGPHYGDHPRFLHGKLPHGVSRKIASPGAIRRTRYFLSTGRETKMTQCCPRTSFAVRGEC